MNNEIIIEPQEYHFNYDTPFETIKAYIAQNGFAIITNVLDQNEINNTKQMFYDWKNSIPNFDKIHDKIDPHGIYKHHEVGHQKHRGLLELDLKYKNNSVNYGILMN